MLYFLLRRGFYAYAVPRTVLSFFRQNKHSKLMTWDTANQLRMRVRVAISGLWIQWANKNKFRRTVEICVVLLASSPVFSTTGVGFLVVSSFGRGVFVSAAFLRTLFFCWDPILQVNDVTCFTWCRGAAHTQKMKMRSVNKISCACLYLFVHKGY